MLSELIHTRQDEAHLVRRWFADGYFDLIVWQDLTGRLIMFQLCYGKPREERALTWRADSGYAHHVVDDGEGRPGKYKGSPVLVADGNFPAAAIAARFRRDSELLEESLAATIFDLLLEAPTEM